MRRSRRRHYLGEGRASQTGSTTGRPQRHAPGVSAQRPRTRPRRTWGVRSFFAVTGVYEHSLQTPASTNAGFDPAHRRPADDSQQRPSNSNLAALAATKRQQHAVAADVRHRARTRHRASVRDQLVAHDPRARRTVQPTELHARGIGRSDRASVRDRYSAHAEIASQIRRLTHHAVATPNSLRPWPPRCSAQARRPNPSPLRPSSVA
jgi:hypothetical protein